MTDAARYIQVILPLKLGWEPFYRVPDYEGDICVGDRVLAPFAGRSYLGVVSATDVAPQDDALPRIRRIYGIDGSKDRILLSEIEFWRLLSVYYMCTVGEVYKAAYPSVKDEAVTPRKKTEEFVPSLPADVLSDASRGLAVGVAKAFNDGRTVLLNAADAESVAIDQCLKRSDGTVLWLVPQLNQERALKQRLSKIFGSRLILWGSNLTAAKKREAARRIRSTEHCVILGTRSSIFLPYSDLSLVIVQDEQDTAFKQTSPSPRYNGRDAAVLLARSFGADVLLCSRTPSFETVYNCLTGRYVLVSDGSKGCNKYEIIDTRAEAFKNGMVGDVSRKLIGLSSKAGRTAVYKSRRSMYPKTEELLPQLSSCLGDGINFSDDIVEHPLATDSSVLAFFGVDSLLGKNDFRSDEHCLQEIRKVAFSLPSLDVAVLQTANSSHPIFNVLKNADVSPLMEERRQYGYPPFSRIVDVIFKDSSFKRAAFMSSELSGVIEKEGGCRVIASAGTVRLIIPRDRNLQGFKVRLRELVSTFEKDHKYLGHITFDVDPA